MSQIGEPPLTAEPANNGHASGCLLHRKASVFDEAEAIVNGPRKAAYGPPALNHGCTATIWRAYLERRYGVELPLDAEDVCVLNALQKLGSRHAHHRQRDNLVDTVGYVRNIELLDA